MEAGESQLENVETLSSTTPVLQPAALHMNPLQEIAFRAWHLIGWEDWYTEKYYSGHIEPVLGTWFLLNEFRAWKYNKDGWK